MKIEILWEELESDKSLYSGLLYKRFSSQIKPDIYVALKAPEKLRCIATHVSMSLHLDTVTLNTMRDIKIETIADEKHPGKQFVLILLLDNQHKDIFSTLCEDLMNQVAEITDETLLIKELLSRLGKWQSLFEKLGLQGLSEEAQRGLYGELFFLRKFLNQSTDHVLCISSWKGPEKAVQDFQFSDWAIEVKTTHGKNHQKIHIASERQLDTDIVSNIYLYHISLDIRDNSGETLNEAIDVVLDLLRENYSALNAFRVKLLNAGYFDIHRDFYSNTGYSIRQQRIFLVTETFPRITESQISGGVGDVRYSIVLADEVPWRISEKDLFHKIGQNNV